MDDIIDISDIAKANKSNNAMSVADRVKNCSDNGKDCTCKYCGFKKEKSKMVFEILLQDMGMAMSRGEYDFCTYDLKIILTDAVLEVLKYEKENSEKENEKEEKKENPLKIED